jgi:hypothetical protein
LFIALARVIRDKGGLAMGLACEVSGANVRNPDLNRPQAAPTQSCPMRANLVS